MTTDPAKLSVDAMADIWYLDKGKRARIEEILNEIYGPRITALEWDNQILREELGVGADGRHDSNTVKDDAAIIAAHAPDAEALARTVEEIKEQVWTPISVDEEPYVELNRRDVYKMLDALATYHAARQGRKS